MSSKTNSQKRQASSQASRSSQKRQTTLSVRLERDAQELYNMLWGNSPRACHSIAPTPVSLERKHLGNLEHTHVVAEKNDGERCLLLVGLPEDQREDSYVVLVSRARKLTVLGRIDKEITARTYFTTPTDLVSIDLCNGTLLDGEWMPDKSFVIFDCVAAGGYDTKGIKSFSNRLRIAGACSKALLPFVSCRVKAFGPLDERESILENPTGPSDGLILMPKEEVVRTGRHETMFKWKPAHKCTLDLVWCGSEFRAVGDGGTLVPATMSVEDVSLVLPHPSTPLVTDMIYEIAPPETVGAPWVIVAPRPDKIAANHIVTIRRTLRTIRDDIRPGEIR